MRGVLAVICSTMVSFVEREARLRNLETYADPRWARPKHPRLPSSSTLATWPAAPWLHVGQYFDPCPAVPHNLCLKFLSCVSCTRRRCPAFVLTATCGTVLSFLIPKRTPETVGQGSSGKVSRRETAAGIGPPDYITLLGSASPKMLSVNCDHLHSSQGGNHPGEE